MRHLEEVKGYETFRTTKTIQNLKERLKEWNKTNVGNILNMAGE